MSAPSAGGGYRQMRSRSTTSYRVATGQTCVTIQQTSKRCVQGVTAERGRVREHRIKDGQLQVNSGTHWGHIHWRDAEWRECWMCGTKFPFEAEGSTGKNKGRFCSVKCNGRWQSKQQLAKRVGKRCPICYLWFKVQPSKAERFISCGRPACRYAVQSQASIRRAEARREKV